jgi:hypothetical protein
MADWQVAFVESMVNPTGFFRVNDLTFSLVNSDEGPMSCEIPLGHPDLTPNLIGPYRTSYTIYRNGTIVTGGIVNSINLNKDRDSLLIGGADFLHYLKRRIWPFEPSLYLAGGWVDWPIRWRQVDSAGIAHRMINAMVNADSYSWPIFPHNGGFTGFLTNYKIFPADPTTIFDHIKTLSELGPDGGFEFAISPITLEFFTYPGGRDSGFTDQDYAPRWTEAGGQLVDFDWNNIGPKGTWTLGLGVGHDGRKMGATKTDVDNKAQFGRLDAVEDFGTVANQETLNRMTDFQGSTNLGPERSLSLSVLNPQFQVPNFYSGGGPRGLIGDRVHAEYDFEYRHVDAYFIVQSLNFDIDNSGNEVIEFELEMIPPRLA